MAKIAETYIHLDIKPSSKFKNESYDYLSQQALDIAGEIFKDDIQVNVKAEEGTYKLWAIITVGAIFTTITHYGSFRSGIDYLVKDIRSFSTFLISKFKKEHKIQDEKIIRVERRLGVPGKIQRLFKRIDKLGEEIIISQSTNLIPNKGSDSSINQEVIIGVNEDEKENIKREIIKILQLLTDKKDKNMFYDSLPEQIKQEFPANLAKKAVGSTQKPAIENKK